MPKRALAGSPLELDRIKAMVRERSGMTLDEVPDLDEQIIEHMNAIGARSPEDYLDRLQVPEVLRDLADALTVRETYFFRGRAGLDALVGVVLPELARQNSDRVSILSAGCATGEEPYSIAMMIRDRLPHLVSRVHIEGADIAPSAIARGRRGKYRAWSLRDTPAEDRERWFEQRGRDFCLHPSIRSMVTLSEQNLASPLAPAWNGPQWDVIFCRHMMMYFSPSAARELVTNFERAIRVGGYLFLAPAETLRGLTHEFELQHLGDSFHYRRRDPSEQTISLETSEPPPPSPPVAAPRPAPRVIRSEPQPAPPPPSVEPARAFDVERELSRAVNLVDAGDHAGGERIATRVLAYDDLLPEAHYLLAVCRAESGDLESAMRHDEAAIFLDPTFAMPQLHLALLAKRSGRRELARRQLERALAAIGKEDAGRLLRFGGGFDRDALLAVCRRELDAGGDGR